MTQEPEQTPEEELYNGAANFGQAFGYSPRKINAVLGETFSVLELNSQPETLDTLRAAIEADGLRVDGDERLVGLGKFAVVTRVASTKNDGTPVEIEGAIGRIETMGLLDNPIILQKAYAKKYDVIKDGEDTAYSHYIVPNAPDIEGQKITFDDIKRTAQVLKAAHADHMLWDIQTSGFVFLKDPDGNIMCYPDSAETPEDFRGKPIAFIRDLNSVSTDYQKDVESGQRRVASALSMTLEDYKALPAAPAECVEACKQQYILTARLADNLRKNGIEPNVDIPVPPSVQSKVAAQQVGAPDVTQQVQHG